jgi:hypothetical protein
VATIRSRVIDPARTIVQALRLGLVHHNVTRMI